MGGGRADKKYVEINRKKSILALFYLFLTEKLRNIYACSIINMEIFIKEGDSNGYPCLRCLIYKRRGDEKMRRFKLKRCMLRLCALYLTLAMVPMTIEAFAADFPECSHGFSTYNDHVLNGGVGQYGNARRYFWINPEISGEYKGYIRSAFDSWIYTTNNPPYYTTSISWRETSTKSDGTIEFHWHRFGDGNTAGLTTFKLYQNEVNSMQQNWGWAYIQLDPNIMDASLTPSKKQWVAAHEIGHAFGCAHCDNPNRLMYPAAKQCNVNTPVIYELQTINHLY